MLPEAHVHYGIRNATTGCYELKVIPLGFHKLPQVFKIEPTQKTDKIKAPSLIRGWQGKWDKRILTGLIVWCSPVVGLKTRRVKV